jgi:hypothetical protein
MPEGESHYTPELKADYTELADELFALQETKNDGRGVSCVRNVVDYLRMGDLRSAQ